MARCNWLILPLHFRAGQGGSSSRSITSSISIPILLHSSRADLTRRWQPAHAFLCRQLSTLPDDLWGFGSTMHALDTFAATRPQRDPRKQRVVGLAWNSGHSDSALRMNLCAEETLAICRSVKGAMPSFRWRSRHTFSKPNAFDALLVSLSAKGLVAFALDRPKSRQRHLAFVYLRRCGWWLPVLVLTLGVCFTFCVGMLRVFLERSTIVFQFYSTRSKAKSKACLVDQLFVNAIVLRWRRSLLG